MATKKKAAPKKTRKASERELAELFQELREEIYVLGKVDRDLERNRVDFPDPDRFNQVERRVLIRSIFALVEAVAWRMKQDASSSPRLSHGERMLTKDLQYSLKDDGSVQTKNVFPATLASVRLAFRTLAKTREGDFELDVSGDGWRKFSEAQKVRNRLTHPKEPSDVKVSDSEIDGCLDGFVWFEKEIARLTNANAQAVEGRVVKMFERHFQRMAKRGR